MISDTDRAYLESLANQIKEATKLTQTRDDAIRLALESGATGPELAKIFGLRRERIYQIRDRRR